MASLALAGVLSVLLSSHGASAATNGLSARPDGYCKQLDLPIHLTVPTAVYDLPPVTNDQEATAWAIWDSTRTTPRDASNIIKNTTFSDTVNIHAQLCFPKSGGETLQIATHGVHYDSRYWDSEFEPESHSYVNAVLKAGYSILTYDRLGVGQSDHPSAHDVVQAPVELEILRQITLKARNGTLYSFAAAFEPHSPSYTLPAPKPNKIVHVSHSFGSVLTSAFIASYPSLTDGALITGYLVNPNLGSPGSVAWDVSYAGPETQYNRSPGYVVCSKQGIQNIFFAGNLSTAYTPPMLAYGDAIKQPAPIGEFASVFYLNGLSGTGLKVPVLFFLAEFDFYICRGDCKGLATEEVLRAAFPDAEPLEAYVQPNTGHAFPLHNNATAGFEVMFGFLGRNGL